MKTPYYTIEKRFYKDGIKFVVVHNYYNGNLELVSKDEKVFEDYESATEHIDELYSDFTIKDAVEYLNEHIKGKK